jgi:hypothetical protein
MEAIIIQQLVDGRFTISTRPVALSEIELRQELARINCRADLIDDLICRVKQTDWVKVETKRIAKLPSGLELWFSENGEAYTDPPRAGAGEIQDTLAEVEEWARVSRPIHPEAVEYWIDVFEDQYPYLSPAMPKRQGREIGREFTLQTVELLMGLSRNNSK